MPRVPRRGLEFPSDWSAVSSTLAEFQSKMREIELKESSGMRKEEILWPIFQLHHQRNRYLFELYYENHSISDELIEFCFSEGYADRFLMAKWKKNGYEKLCCLKCVQTVDSNFGSVCVCRLPEGEEEKILQCKNCGCTGCASNR